MARSLSSTSATGEFFGVHPETLRRLYRSGRIPGYKVGRYLRFDVDEVRAALRSPAPSTSPAHAVPDFDALDAA